MKTMISSKPKKNQYVHTELKSLADINDIQCDHAWAQSNYIDTNIYDSLQNEFVFNPYRSPPINDEWTLTSSFFSRYSLLRMSNSDSVVGIARNGVLIFTSLTD